MLNEFKSKLENGEFVYGVFVKTSDPMFNGSDRMSTAET